MSRKNGVPKVDKTIPIPPPPNTTKNKYPFIDMDVGDSFWTDNHTARQSAYHYGKSHGKLFTCRMNGSGLRIWRIK